MFARDSLEYPKLRPVEAFPLAARGEQLIALRDTSGLCEEMVLVPPDLLPLLSLFDGEHSLKEIGLAYLRRSGNLFGGGRLQTFIAELDSRGLLESENFFRLRAQLEQEFRAQPNRDASLAGKAYPAEPEALRGFLESLLAQDPVPDDLLAQGPPRALVAPHIDLARGAACYGIAYRLLRETRPDPPEVCLVLGIAHAGGRVPFILTRKNFATPLGQLRTDVALVERLAQACPEGFDDELLHRREHSIELQLLFLQAIYGERAQRLVPVLCSAIHRDGNKVVDPSGRLEVAAFLEALRGILQELGEKALVIAGADLSHVGMRFGSQAPLSYGLLESVKRNDLRLLAPLESGDAAGFFSTFQETEDRTNVCGFPALYLLARLFEAGTIRLLKYDQAVEPQTQSVVSFASLGIW